MKRLNWEGLKYYHKKLIRMLESWQLANQLMISTAYTAGDNITIENGVISAEIPEDLATEQWVEEQGYLTEHQDISGKVNVSDFEESELVTSAALNNLNLRLVDKDSETQLLQEQVAELQNQTATLFGYYNELESIIG